MDAATFGTPLLTNSRHMPETALRLDKEAISNSKKRKRGEKTAHDLKAGSFVIKPYPTNPFFKTRTLKPLILLPRSHLPLSYLDISSSAKFLGKTRLFEAHVTILELEERLSSQPTVLVASCENSRTLFVLERENPGLYTLLQLGSWVNLEHLQDVVAPKFNLVRPCLPSHRFSPGILSVTDNQVTSKIGHKKRIAIERLQSMVKKSSPLPEEQPLSQANEIKIPSINEDYTVDTHFVPQERIENVLTLSLDEIFDTIRLQYYDTLYLSRASLAYFAKGPLSRARAALDSIENDSGVEFKKYVILLESLIMPIAPIDKKYREEIPRCIKVNDTQEDHSAEEVDRRDNKQKIRRKKKLKPGKNGLYPGEDILIRKWWTFHKDNVDPEASESTKNMHVRTHISQLRIRETQLQMILILESLALRPSALLAEENCDELPKKLASNDPKSFKQKVTHLKKSDYLANLIDTHIDRLCIWQTVALDSIDTSTNEEQKLFAISHQSSEEKQKPVQNLLKDFCIEVIMPFYSSRLPDRCALISRNLGGLVTIHPPKSKSSKSNKATATPSRIGAITKRPIFSQNLKQVLIDDRERRRSISRGPSKALALMKSATMPILLGSKGESTDTSMPINTPKEKSFKTGDQKSNQFPKLFQNGTIGFQTNTKAPIYTQKNIETQLTDAISLLKKPNRQLFAKEFVDSAERRLASSMYSKQPKNIMKNQAPRAIQISATPKSQRNRNIHDSQCVEDKLTDIVSPSRSNFQSQFDASSSFHDHDPTKNSLFSIQATPTKNPISKDIYHQKSYDVMDEKLISSPFSVIRSSAQLFQGVSQSAVGYSSVTDEFSHGITETPVKKRALELDYSDL